MQTFQFHLDLSHWICESILSILSNPLQSMSNRYQKEITSAIKGISITVQHDFCTIVTLVGILTWWLELLF